MKVKWIVKKDKFPAMESTIEGLKGRKVIVGALEGDHAWLAGIHEYGVDIEVTPKMRAYLHGQGLHLKKTTTHIKIPERAFLRNGHDKYGERVMKQTKRATGQVLAGKMSLDTYLDLYGQQMVSAIRKYMAETEDNHPFTVQQKGSSTPLVGRTKRLRQNITWKKE